MGQDSGQAESAYADPLDHPLFIALSVRAGSPKGQDYRLDRQAGKTGWRQHSERSKTTETA